MATPAHPVCPDCGAVAYDRVAWEGLGKNRLMVRTCTRRCGWSTQWTEQG